MKLILASASPRRRELLGMLGLHIDIFVPDNINVKVSSNCIFGGISNKTSVHKDAPTIYISGTCMFGGVEIK